MSNKLNLQAMGKSIFYEWMRTALGFHRGLFIVLMLITPIMAQFQGGENSAREPQYNVSSERFFNGPDGTILMNINVWGHVNVPGRHMVFDGIDLATLLSVVGGPKGGANLKNVRLFRETEDDKGELIYTINLEKFLKTGDRSEFVKVMPNDTYIIPQTTSSYIIEQVGTLNTILSVINIYLQMESRN